MRYLSVCSGIEAATVAWHPLGWEPVAFSEIEPFPSAVLSHHYPDVPNWGDMTKHEEWPDADIDILVGGTPCQAFSIAGLREGLADPRGNLTLVFLGVLDQYRPEWVVWENVPGVLSDETGAFGAFLGGLGELGYGFAYRILDAQHFGVPQRRRRVFVVGHLGDWRRAAAVLFERESLRGDSAPSREAGEDVAGVLTSRASGGGGGPGAGTDEAAAGYLQPVADTVRSHPRPGSNSVGNVTVNHSLIANALRAQPNASHRADSDNYVAHSLRAEGFDTGEDGTGRGTPLVPTICPALKARDYKGPSSDGDGDGVVLVPVAFHNRQDPDVSGDVTHPLGARDNGLAVAFAQNQRDEVRTMDVAAALAAEPGAKQQTYLAQTMAVRRLTPLECERLQGFPNDYTRIPYRNKPANQCPDGPRYKALGNSMAVPVMRWLGERIAMVAKC